ncbi:MAG: hypothetical protein OXG92_07335 [Chloroflexi bacterium]|nr:hypothetical protein [Chloroflexota bacterium]MCY3583805.1 hypothetical protein [Chloroflexota bacterium]MCY3716263.1 hypothetical protein [Chloroflexota bacterium]MDE2650408.1 hypothetical protein [Chloroflexota bacterium]MXV92612.1 hypothetical protein [Chloroflexota bacterium]
MMTKPDAPARPNPLQRLGCLLLLIAWFALLLLPCGLFYLAANGEIRLQHRDIPQPHAHPLLLISLVSEERERGLRIETSAVVASQPALCVETAVRFVLWQSSGGDQNARYCDCYARGADESWLLHDTSAGTCQPPGA